MLLRNTAQGGRGFTVDGVAYKVPAGGESEVPTESVVSARKDPIVDGWFVDGTLVLVASAPADSSEVKPDTAPPLPGVTPEPEAEKPAAADPKAKPKK